MTRAMCLTLRVNILLERGTRQYENQSVVDLAMAFVEADVREGEKIGIIIFSSGGMPNSLRCNISRRRCGQSSGRASCEARINRLQRGRIATPSRHCRSSELRRPFDSNEV
jgi:hypothetical protein